PPPAPQPAPAPVPVPAVLPLPLPQPVIAPGPSLQVVPLLAPAPIANFFAAPAVAPAPPPPVHIPVSHAVPAPPGGATVSQPVAQGQASAAHRREEAVDPAVAHAEVQQMSAYSPSRSDPVPLFLLSWVGAVGMGIAG